MLKVSYAARHQYTDSAEAVAEIRRVNENRQENFTKRELTQECVEARCFFRVEGEHSFGYFRWKDAKHFDKAGLVRLWLENKYGTKLVSKALD